MRKIFLLVIVLGAVMVMPDQALAQQNAVKINIFSPIFKTINVSYERALTDASSFQLGFYYTGASVSSLNYSGMGITPEYRFYLSETPAPAGFYVAPFLRYQSVKLTIDESTSEGKFSAFGGGVVIGKQWVFKQRITLDMFIGPAYNSGKVKVTNGSEDEFDLSGAFDGFGIRTGLTLGVAF